MLNNLNIVALPSHSNEDISSLPNSSQSHCSNNVEVSLKYAINRSDNLVEINNEGVPTVKDRISLLNTISDPIPNTDELASINKNQDNVIYSEILKHSSTLHLDKYKLSKRITEHHSNQPQWHDLYTLVLLLSYSFFLAFTTLYSWKELSTEWIYTQLIVRLMLFVGFLLDFYHLWLYKCTGCLSGEVQIMVDFVFTLFDIAIIIHIISILIIGSDNLNIKGSILIISLRSISCISVFRLYKLCYVFTPLLKLSHGIIYSIYSVFWTAVFIIIVLFSCSVVSTWTLNDLNDSEMYSFWGTLPKSMFTLFTVLTLEGWNEVTNRTAVRYPNCKLFFVIFVSFTTIAVMNVVTGIILDSYNYMNERLSVENRYKNLYEKYYNAVNIINNAINAIELKTNSSNTINCEQIMTTSNIVNHELDDDRDIMNSPESAIENTPKYFFGYNRLHEQYTHFNINSLSTKACTLEKELTSHVNCHTNRASSDSGHLKNDKDGISFRSLSLMCPNIEQESNGLKDVEPAMDSNNTNNDSIARIFIPQDGNDHDAPPFYLNQYGSINSNPTNGNHAELQDVENEIIFAKETKKGEVCDEFNGIIQLSDEDPFKILDDPAMEDALKLANIPKQQAFDVLSLYWSSGYKIISVYDFVSSCSKTIGSATNRQLMGFEVSFGRRIDNIECSIAEVNKKMDVLFSMLSKTHKG